MWSHGIRFLSRPAVERATLPNVTQTPESLKEGLVDPVLTRARDNPSVRTGSARTVALLGIQQHDAETIVQKLNEVEAYQRQQGVGGGRPCGDH